MNEQLITPELLGLAESKGFERYTVQEPLKFELEPGDTMEHYPGITLSFLQKWLREVHKIYVQPILIAQLSPHHGWGYELTYPIKSAKQWENTDESVTHSTYEEALTEGLTQALNLLP